MMIVQHQVISIRQSLIILIAAIFFLFVLTAFNRPGFQNIKFYFLSGGLLFFGLISYVLSKTKIIIDNSGITFQYLIRKSIFISWADITESKLEYHFDSHGGNFHWKILFSNERSHDFQPSFYSRKNLKPIAEAFVTKCPGAIFDKRILKMSEGKFPWYIF